MKKIIMACVVLALLNTNVIAQEVVIIKKTSKDSSGQPLMVIDGVVTNNVNMNEIAPSDIQSISIIKGEMAKKKYGTSGDKGVVEITSKKNGAKENVITKGILIDTTINSTIDSSIHKNINLSIVVDGDKITINGKPADKNDPRLKVIKRNGMVTVTAPKHQGQNIPETNEEEFNIDMQKMMAPPSPPANRAFLGVITEATETGAKINSVSEGSPAKIAGLKEDDIITKVNELKIDGPNALYEAVGSYQPEEKITITFIRGGKEQKISAVLAKNKAAEVKGNFSFAIPNGQMPNNLRRGFRISPDQNFKFEMPEMPELDGLTYPSNKKPKLGISIEDTESGDGVRIKNIVAGSNADKAGLKVNDIITQFDNKKVTDVSDLKWEYLLEGQVLKFSISRNGEKKNIEVKIPKKLKTANL
jgi:serine protease Do